MAKVFQDIELLRLNGNIELAEKKLTKALRSFSSLPEGGQSFVIRMLAKFGHVSKALSYLDKEFNSEEIKKVSITAIVNQCILARLKFNYGSTDVTHRMCKTIAHEVISRKDIPDSERRVIWESLITSFLLCQDYHSACEFSSNYPEIKSENKEEDFFFQLSYLASRCYQENKLTAEILDQFQKLRTRYSNPFNQWLVDTFEIGMVCDFEMLDEVGKTDAYILRLHKMLNSVSYFKSLANGFLGVIHLHRKQTAEAIQYFQEGLKCAVSFQERMRPIFFLEKILGKKVPLADRIYLRCFSTFNEYAYLLGSRFRFEPGVDLPILRRELNQAISVDPERDCWVIKNGEITLAHYDELPAQENVLDLLAGFFWKEGEAKYHLPDARSSILIYTIGASQYGVTDSYLIEKIYSDEFRNSLKGFERIRNQVIQLKRLGLKIKQKNRTYFYDFEQNPYTIIFPVTHQSHGVVAYCRKVMNLISAKAVADELNISESTASLHIRVWKDLKLIKRSPDDPYGVWTFV